MIDKRSYLDTKISRDPKGKEKYIEEKMIKHLGEKTWTFLFEECGELIQAVSKLKRFGKVNKKSGYDNSFNLLEEVADVHIESMIALKQLGYTDEDFERMVQYKLNKLNRKMNEGSLLEDEIS